MRLRIEPLSNSNFSIFGSVISKDSAEKKIHINQGYCTRHHNLATVDTSQNSGSTAINIFSSTPLPLPMNLTRLEHHPLSSQCFFPLSHRPYLVVVAPPGSLTENAIRAFIAQPNQGVNYAAGTWHHFCLALDEPSDFLVIDRVGPGENCIEQALSDSIEITLADIESAKAQICESRPKGI